MTSSSPWQRAHVEILERGLLPVRTHRRPAEREHADVPPAYVGHHTRNAAAKAARRLQIRALRDQGLGVKEIAAQLQLSGRCVEIHLKAIKQEKP